VLAASRCSIDFYAFAPAAKFHGLSFGAVALAVARDCDAVVLAAHIDGAIRVSPWDEAIQPNTVLFALAPSQAELSAVAKDGNSAVASWIKTFQANRKTGIK
jgi:hypothetical protein